MTQEPGTPAAGNPGPASRRPASRGNGTLGALLLAFGILITLVGGAVLTGGIFAASANQFRDSEGYFSVPTETFSTPGYALTSPPGEVSGADPAARNLPFDLATLRLGAKSTDSNIFIGIAPMADIDRYLAGVKHAEISSVSYHPFAVEYLDSAGTRTPAPPAKQQFWAASAMGPGLQEIQWNLTPGQWGVVVMNADGTPGVTTDLAVGVRSDLLAPIASTLIIVGAVLLAIGVPMLIIGAVILGRRNPAARNTARAGSFPAIPSPMAAQGGQVQATGGVFPAHLYGRLDGNPSRGLWLVKWLLAIPHYVVLAFLWLAFVVTTLIAGFAILFTGRYPHALFGFNVGVLRWTWRVGFYSYSALGTDRYPPFTLARTDYPADFDIDYPERLNRGLVLVKWWLLAIPHYLILGAISVPVATGNSEWRNGWNYGWDTDTERNGISLVVALVVIAGFALLFTARYPVGLFNLVVGINRWIFRVVTYAALFRDEYPPFRLDQGPDEPALARPHPPGTENPAS